MFDPITIGIIAAVGLLAGTLGGMLGVGGSVIMIPALALLFGQDKTPGFNQHLYQAAAMIVNVAVALPAARRHYRSGTMSVAALKFMLPAALLLILVGVWTSNLPIFSSNGEAAGPVLLGRVMAAFLLYVIGLNIYRMIRPAAERATLDDAAAYITKPRGLTVGSIMGFVAGLLGIGGGAVSVPLQQVLLKLPLRSCIANSSAIICLTAGFGAIFKNATLSQHSLHWQDSLLIAALLSPTALVGGHLGAHLTHVFPVRIVRVIFIALMILAAWKMAAL